MCADPIFAKAVLQSFKKQTGTLSEERVGEEDSFELELFDEAGLKYNIKVDADLFILGKTGMHIFKISLKQITK